MTHYDRPACVGCKRHQTLTIAGDVFDVCNRLAFVQDYGSQYPHSPGAQAAQDWLDEYQNGPVDPNPPPCPSRE